MTQRNGLNDSAWPSTERPELSEEDKQLILAQAANLIRAAVCGQPVPAVETALGPLARTPLYGVFVSLKRAGQLRSCCGHVAAVTPLGRALVQAAWRTATDDPRFPPISPSELKYLHLEVWLLWGLEPIPPVGEDRVRYVEIGRHGLQIARGEHRGLLLPGVAVEHCFDAEQFLEQVCFKAGLPADAWKLNDTQLARFEGMALQGKLGELLGDWIPQQYPVVASAQEFDGLVNWCRQNITSLLIGATPYYYAPGLPDGQTCGLVLEVVAPDGRSIALAQRILLRPQLPLQATLFELTSAVADRLRRQRVGAAHFAQMPLRLVILTDPAMHGTVQVPALEGFTPSDRALFVSAGNRWSLVFAPGSVPEKVLDEALKAAGMETDALAGIVSFHVTANVGPFVYGNAPQPETGPEVRLPAVAGRFYPDDPTEVNKWLDELIPDRSEKEKWAAALVPHAGWQYSGRLAGEVLSRVFVPDRVLIFAPKHTPAGTDWAVAPYMSWAIPGGQLAADPELARRLALAVDRLQLDAAAHQREHAIEVLLPFVARLAPHAKVTGIVVHGGTYQTLKDAARQVADVLAKLEQPPLLVISTDMNHYADDRFTRQVDRLAIDRLTALDPEGLFNTVRSKRISMCGVIPAVLVLETLRALGQLNRAEVVGYSTSGEVTGDKQRVVGYLGMLFG